MLIYAVWVRNLLKKYRLRTLAIHNAGSANYYISMESPQERYEMRVPKVRLSLE